MVYIALSDKTYLLLGLLSSLIKSISVHKKTLIYKIDIRLKSQVLSKEECRLVADRQTCNQIMLLELKALGHWIDSLTT